VKNKENNKPRGYAFIVFEHERDMKSSTDIGNPADL
jgi:RNA recognition motif-containing protein